MTPQVVRISPPTVELFDPSNNSLGVLNEYELNAFRISVMKTKATGYYVLDSDGTVCELDTNGRFNRWPSILNLMCDQLGELI